MTDDARVRVVTGWRIIQSEPSTARVLFSGVRFSKATEKAKLQGSLTALEGKRAA